MFQHKIQLEILGTLSLLQNLWLEGNPICCGELQLCFHFIPEIYISFLVFRNNAEATFFLLS
jgi:hypothetical protein